MDLSSHIWRSGDEVVTSVRSVGGVTFNSCPTTDVRTTARTAPAAGGTQGDEAPASVIVDTESGPMPAFCGADVSAVLT